MSTSLQWVLLEDGITWHNKVHGLFAYVKWDGCTHIWFKDYDSPHKLGCYHHICDIDEFIKVMQSLREHAARKSDQELEAMSEQERKTMSLPFHKEQEMGQPQ